MLHYKFLTINFQLFNDQLLINSKNVGPSKAKNQGIINSQGKYILFLDSDTEMVYVDAISMMVKILEENKIKAKIPEELTALIKSEINLEKHLGKNKHDQVAKRGLILTESKIRRLAKYYKSSKKLPSDWKYDREKAELLIS